jgi:hypothetical protein
MNECGRQEGTAPVHHSSSIIKHSFFLLYAPGSASKSFLSGTRNQAPQEPGTKNHPFEMRCQSIGSREAEDHGNRRCPLLPASTGMRSEPDGSGASPLATGQLNRCAIGHRKRGPRGLTSLNQLSLLFPLKQGSVPWFPTFGYAPNPEIELPRRRESAKRSLVRSRFTPVRSDECGVRNSRHSPLATRHWDARTIVPLGVLAVPFRNPGPDSELHSAVDIGS